MKIFFSAKTEVHHEGVEQVFEPGVQEVSERLGEFLIRHGYAVDSKEGSVSRKSSSNIKTPRTPVAEKE